MKWLDGQRICLSPYQLLLPDVLLAYHISSGLYISLNVLPSWAGYRYNGKMGSTRTVKVKGVGQTGCGVINTFDNIALWGCDDD